MKYLILEGTVVSKYKQKENFLLTIWTVAAIQTL